MCDFEVSEVGVREQSLPANVRKVIRWMGVEAQENQLPCVRTGDRARRIDRSVSLVSVSDRPVALSVPACREATIRTVSIGHLVEGGKSDWPD